MLSPQRFRFELFTGWEEALQATTQPFIDGFFPRYGEYLQVIEKGQKERMGFFVVAVTDEQKGIFVGWLYGQIVDFKGKYLMPVFEHEEKKAPWWVKTVNRYETKLFYMGNLFFPGDNGFYLREEYTTPLCRAEIINNVYPLLQNFLLSKCHGGIFSVADYAIESLKPPMISSIKGFNPFFTEPYMFLMLDPSWQTIDDYMSALSSKYRVRLKKVMQESSVLETKLMDNDALELHAEDIHRLYLSVAEKASFNLGYAHPGYFRDTLEVSGGSFQVVGYWLEGKLIGFNSWFLGTHGDLHAHYIGLDYQYVSTYKLYNRMLIDLVDQAISTRSVEIHFGRTAVEIKSTLGAVPANMVINLRHTRGWANRLIGIPSNWSKPPDFEVRHPFK